MPDPIRFTVRFATVHLHGPIHNSKLHVRAISRDHQAAGAKKYAQCYMIRYDNCMR